MDTLVLKANPEELRTKFLSISSPQDIADLLEIDLKRLYYHIYVVPESSRYTTFDIPKRRGGVRTISSPATPLKIIQRKLNQVLLQVYTPKPSVHSFLPNRSILSNAKVHAGRRNILNIDLESFFPSINFGRVRGLFMGTPYNLNPRVATILAQICCFNNQIPQGAPTSPIISNMICAKMDSELIKLAKANKSDYTRYSDDITFSTNLREFPSDCAILNDLGQIEIGVELNAIITQNGFKINDNKTRMRGKSLRQEVTGITINKFPNVRRKYVRQIRAMLHAWEIFGLDAAQEEFWNNYDKKHRSLWTNKPLFKRVVKGKIEFLGMVRGKTDRIYLNLCSQLKTLAPELVKLPIENNKADVLKLTNVYVITEGKTDWKHMKNANTRLSELGYDFGFDIEFDEFEEDMGDHELLKLCRSYAKIRQSRPTIFMFDRDNLARIKEALDEPLEYKIWGNNTYSMAIPIPTHRRDSPNISIEFYYKDEELTRQDKAGRRLFLSNEFLPTGWHTTSPYNCHEINCHEINRIKNPNVSVIDSQVNTQDGKNLALSKNDFAENVINRENGFRDFDVIEFSNIFNIISKIIKAPPVINS